MEELAGEITHQIERSVVVLEAIENPEVLREGAH